MAYFRFPRGVSLLVALFALSALTSRADEPTADPRFDVYEYRVLGNTVLDARLVEKAVYPFLGPDKTLHDVEAARASLETAYHDAGYGTVFVDIPEQSVDDGIVRLHAAEGRLHSVTVSGQQYFSGRQILTAVPAATSGAVPSLPALQDELGKVNAATPDRAVVPVLKAGPLPGTVDLDLKVDDHVPLHGSLELNNQYTSDTKPLRLNGALSYDNMFGHYDSLSLQYQVAPQHTPNLGVFVAGYSYRLDDGGHVAFSFIDSSSDVATVGSLDVLGKGRIWGIHYDTPVVSRPGEIQSVTVGVDYKRLGQTVNAGLGATVPTPLSYGLLSVGYLGSKLSDARMWTWNTTAEMVIRGTGSAPINFDDKCYNCRPNEFLLRADGSLSEHLGHGFDAVVKAAGQYAVDPIVSNEQFLIGGAQSVRGYFEAEALGDSGLRGSLEFHAPNLFQSSTTWFARPVVFYDAGKIFFDQPLPSQARSEALASYGGGLNLQGTHWLTGTLYWAHALKAGAETREGQSRWLFSVKGAF